MPKRKSRPDAKLSEEEAERRRRQREMREQALAARANGEAFESTRRVTFPKRKPLEARKEEKRIARRKVENAARRRAVQTAVKKERAAAPEVVVVPIFWKGEANQMARVLSACTDAQAALAAAGRRVLLDAGHKYTPGQKFAHWEHKGVLLRVEIGPREADKGWCTVARTFVAGESAHRVPRVPISSKSLPEEVAKLAALDAPAGDTEVAAGDNKDAEPAMEQPQPAQRGGGGDVGGGRRGDDLDDDFVEAAAPAADEADEEEAARPSPAGKKRKATEKGLTKASAQSRKKVVQF